MIYNDDLQIKDIKYTIEKYKCSICKKESYNDLEFEICDYCDKVVCLDCLSSREFDINIKCKKCDT